MRSKLASTGGAPGHTAHGQVRRLTGPVAQAEATVDGALREYLWWCVERLTTDLGLEVDDPAAAVEHHHQGFREELPNLLGARGRLLVAELDGTVAGVGALKPVDDTTAELKRMYVRPWARGNGIGRALLARLLADAAELGYRTVRLETVVFMTEAQALYRSLGFRPIPMFDEAEASMSAGLAQFMLFMELPLGSRADGRSGPSKIMGT